MRSALPASVILALLLASCGKQTNVEGGQNQATASAESPASVAAPTAPAYPSASDASHALPVAMANLPPNLAAASVWFGQTGTPHDCLDGNLNGQAVAVCKVCVNTVLFAPTITHLEDIRPAKLIITIPFKKALSYDNPGISPANGNAGVWVSAQQTGMSVGPGQAQPTVFTIDKNVFFQPEMAEAMGLHVAIINGGREVSPNPIDTGGYFHIPPRFPPSAYTDLFVNRRAASIDSLLGPCT